MSLQITTNTFMRRDTLQPKQDSFMGLKKQR